MTPFWVTRQFHCPEVLFFLFCAPGWRLLAKGGSADGMASNQTGDGGEEALVNTHEQSFSLAVSAEGGTIKRGDEAEPLSLRRGRHWFWVHLSFLFWRGYCWGLSLKTHCLLISILPFDPDIQICHVAAYLYLRVCTSKSFAVKPAITWFSPWYQYKHPFTLTSNYKQA